MKRIITRIVIAAALLAALALAPGIEALITGQFE
jgi:hypothetical protein